MIRAALILGLALLSGAAARPDTVWTRVFDSGNDDDVSDMVALPGGAVVATGRASVPGNSGDVLLLKLTDKGDTVWVRITGTTAGESGDGLALAPDGGFAVAGGTYADDDFGVLAVRFDSAGNVVWRRTYGDTGRVEDGYCIAACPDGGWLLAANRMREPGSDWGQHDLWLLRLDDAGDTLWTRVYADSMLGFYPEMVTTMPGGFAVAASLSEMEASDNAVVLRIDGSGNELGRTVLWSGGDGASCVAAFPAGGGLVAVGYSSSSADYADTRWAQLDALGPVTATKTYAARVKTGPAVWRAWNAARLPDGGMFVAGATQGGSGSQPVPAVLRLDAAGKELWRRSYETPQGMGRAQAVAALPDGGCVLGCWAAESYGSQSDIYFIRVKP